MNENDTMKMEIGWNCKLIALSFLPVILFLIVPVTKVLAVDQKEEIRLYQPYRSNGRPDWSMVSPARGEFVPVGYRKPTDMQMTVVKAAYDLKNLYLLFDCSEKAMDKVVAAFDGPDIWQDDCVEIFIDGELDRCFYHQFVISVSGRKYAWGRSRAPLVGAWMAKVRCYNEGWQAEAMIPFEVIGIIPYPVRMIGISFCRERRAGSILELSTWTPPLGFRRPNGRLLFGSYRDYLLATRQKLQFSLQELLRIEEEEKDKHQSLMVDECRRLLTEANELAEKIEITSKEFTAWLGRWEAFDSPGRLDELRYRAKINRLLNPIGD